MKIQKFNEGVELKDDNVLSEYFKSRDNFKRKKEKIVDLLNEFKSYYDTAYWRSEYGLGLISDCYFTKELNKLTFQSGDNYYTLMDEDFKKLLDFLEDPELYKNTRKYNI